MAPTHPFSLLMVEDDVAARDIIVTMIEVKFRGCTVHTADNGKQGLELFKKYNPPMVITDINMPVMDGVEMARAIRAINADTSFIVITAYGDEHFRRIFSELGLCSFLVKPLNFPELFASIEKYTAENK